MRKYKIFIVFLAFLIFLNLRISYADISVIGGLTHHRTVKPGEIYSGNIIVRNKSDDPAEIKIYQTDYLFFSDGSNKYGKPGEVKRSNAKWVKFNPDRLVISAKGMAKLSYTVNVPKDENLTGTYWSMLMIESSGKPITIDDKREKQVGIRQVVRYGIQLVASIGNTGIIELNFLNFKLIKNKKGEKLLNIDLENTGEKWLKVKVWTEIYEKTGAYIGKFEAAGIRIYPGTSVRRSMNLTDLPAGQYKALIVADGGGDQVFGANYNIEIKK